MQYGLDSAVIGSLQAMPGFLVVFGYPDPNAPGGYSIGVSPDLHSIPAGRSEIIGKGEKLTWMLKR
jgi:hypothetical protein